MVDVFNHTNADKSEISAAGETFIMTLYGEKTNEKSSAKSLDELRYYEYQKVTARKSLQSTFELESLPPTSDAARQHSFRVYAQVQEWRCQEISVTEWGWKLDGDRLIPVQGTVTPAPEERLNMISFNCRVMVQNLSVTVEDLAFPAR